MKLKQETSLDLVSDISLLTSHQPAHRLHLLNSNGSHVNFEMLLNESSLDSLWANLLLNPLLPSRSYLATATSVQS